MAAAPSPTTSGIKQNESKTKEDDKSRPPTVEEILIQIENHLYNSIEHRASLLIAAWTCLGGQIGYFRSLEKVFNMMYRESALMIFSKNWPKVDILFKRGLSRSLIQYSHSMGSYVKGSEGLCSALVMAAYDPWGDPIMRQLLNKQDVDLNKVTDFVKSEPCELLLIRVECLVKSHHEEGAIRLCRNYLQCYETLSNETEKECERENWKLSFMEWLLRLLFRKRRLNDLVQEISSCSCHDGVRIIYRTLNSSSEDSEALTESLINLFLVRDLLFQSNYCCTSELMNLWCELQAKKQTPLLEIQEAARKLLVGHASSSAQFYLFVDILWSKFGIPLLPLYLELYVRGLTSDLNFLEAARQTDKKEYVIELENHMAAMYFKLSSLFNSINKEVSLECLLSSFSLNPTPEVLEWIKKTTLQVTKERAIRSSGNPDATKHNRSTCTHSRAFPTPTKRKAVVMCDQAIQVGDDSFVECANTANVVNTSTQNEPVVLEDVMHERKKVATESTVLSSVSKQNTNADELEAGHSELPNSSKESSSVLENSPVVTKEKIQIELLENKKQTLKSFRKPKISNNQNKLTKKENSKTEDVIAKRELVPNSIENTPDSKNTTDCIKVIEDIPKSENESNCNKVMENQSAISGDHSLISVNHTTNKSLTNGLSNESDEINCSDKAESLKCPSTNEENLKNIPTEEIIVAENNIKLKTDDNNDENEIVKSDSNQEKINDTHPHCVNGFDKPENDTKIENETSQEKTNLVNETEIPDPDQNIVNQPDSTETQKKSPELLNRLCDSEVLATNDSLQKPASNCTLNENRVTRRSELLKNQSSVLSFSHVILDCNVPGLSSDLLSDFVTVLESLRNKQLKSSCKWSQIKHLCEDYMETVSEQRCMMFNFQTNGSVDSEADSTSELTANGFDFEQNQSSIREDRVADKSHIFKRFMNSDKMTEMATYVNLSDIHCPQIPLEKLFYTEYSSSRGGHKKRHKKHRNHDKSPKKQVLHKLRHGSRTEHDLIKRKKRKKRKTKRGKGHVKKHHSTHGKVSKIHSKNKRKKHKLKKKKEGNSGFISGDYCSDFSSEELMRIVKEHSNSYSKIPASTSKHPHIVETASSSESEPMRKKRKVSFDKKRSKDEKYREKHKHEKSNKHKKKITLESCKTSVTNVIHDNPIQNNMKGVKEFPHFVQISRVKKMESVQIQQRSVSVVDDSTNDTSPMTCDNNPHIKQYVQQKFENCSPEELMKMQILMARQQAEVTASSSAMSTNQALRKYVCSKMTSQLLSVSQSSKCIVGSDSDTSKSPTPHFVDNSAKSKPGPSQSRNHPQKISANIKHFVLETNKTPYKFPSSNVSTTVSNSIIPINISGSTYSDAQNLIGSMLNSNIRSPTTQIPQVTALSIPVSQNHPSGSKLVTSKIIIPLPPSGQLHSGAVSSNLSVIQPDSSFPTTTSSSFIVIKNGNQTQIFQNPQNSCNIIPQFATANTSLTPALAKIGPNAYKTVPKMIKQAPKKSFQPVVKRQLIKNPAPIKQLTAPKAASLIKPVPKAIALTAPSAFSSVATTKMSKAAITTASLPDVDLHSTVAVPIPLPLPAISPQTTEDTTIKTQSSSEIKNDDCENNKSVILVPPSSDPVSSNKANETVSDIATNKTILSEQVEEFQKPSEEKHPIENSTNMTANSMEHFSTNILPSEVKKLCSNKDSIKDSMSSLENSLTVESKLLKEKENVFEEKIANTSSKVEIKTEELFEKSDNVNKSTSLLPESATVAEDKIVDNAEMNAADSTTEHLMDFKSSQSNSTPVAEPMSPKPSPVLNPEPSVEPSPDSKESNSSSKSVLNHSNQQKQLQPINTISIMASMKTPGKTHSLSKTEGMVASEVQTRSFTSISDAVRFSLMDMDDATDSVENQVLQAFQVTHETSQSPSPRYENSSTNDDNEQPVSPSAVILTTPQSSTTTDLNVSQVSQRFEASVHSSQTEKFADCQSAVSRTTSWILEDSAINETSQNMNLQKSPDIDSSCEGKEEEKPKKKKKRKDRCDPEAAHKFWCEICHKGFFSAYNLRRHCRNVHKMALPKGTSDLPFGPNSHSHQHVQQGESSSSEIASPPRLPYGSSQSSCVSPKGPDYILQSPTRDTKTHEFAAKVATSLSSPMQTDFQMQTAVRITGQATSSHISSAAAAKSVQSDFQLPTPTTVSGSHITSNKIQSATKTAATPKFQRLPTSCSTATVSQIAVCGQQSALQQQRQLNQIQSSGLIQPVPSVACQAQQLQAAQCPHFQSKQIAQQRIGQLQLMHHATQIPAIQHAAHGIQKQTPVQQYKKCGAALQSSKMTDTEQIQQNAQLAQTQQILANQQMQKIMQIRQNAAIAASGVASQLSLGTGVSGAQSSNAKAAAAAQCFQSQLAVARQAAAVAQLSVTQRGQAASFALASHDSTGHQFFTPAIQPSPEQSSCTHTSFTAQNLVEYSANAPSYPTIRLSSEANDGLEDLEQFLMENMPWSSDQTASHGISQQSGNRPSSADSLTLTIPAPASSQGKSKTPISRPKPRKPVVASCSKNLLGNLSRGVKKKSTPKKAQKQHVDINCPTSKTAIFTQNCVKNQQSHGLDLIQMHCDKATASDLKQMCKTTTINETDSSDSVQCINVGHHAPSKNVSVGINFNTFVPTSSGIISDKNITPSYNVDLANSRLFGVQSKSPFLEHGNLVNKNSPNLCQNKSVVNPCEINPHNLGNNYPHVEKGPSFNPAVNFCPSVCASIVTKRAETGQDIFLGQRNSEIGESSSCVTNKQNSVSTETNVNNPHCFEKAENNFVKDQNHETIVQADPFLGGRTGDTEHSVNRSDGSADCVTNVKQNSSNDIADCVTKIKDKDNNSEMKDHVMNQTTSNNADSYHNSNAESNRGNFSIVLDSSRETKSKLLSYENLITHTPETTIINSTINTEQMQELGLKEAIGINTKPILKEKVYPLECGEFNVSKNINSSKQSFNGFSVSRILDSEPSPDLVNSVCAKKIDNKENVSFSSPTTALDHTKSVYKNCDKSVLLPKFEDSEKDSSQDKISVKGEKFPPETLNENNDKSSKQNGKINNKLPDNAIVDNEETDSLKQNITENLLNNNKKSKKDLKKNTADENATIGVIEENQSMPGENLNVGVVNDDQNEGDLKLDINSNIEKVLIKDKTVNGTICTTDDFYQKVESKIIQKDTQNEDSNCGDTKHDGTAIPHSRLRLRDTPKTSVKRVCPCCVDSRAPKKCRAPKVHNTVKSKSTLKTRNSSIIQNSKVNTRSSQRLRSRHNAVS